MSRVVVLTNAGPYGERIMLSLAHEGVVPAAILIGDEFAPPAPSAGAQLRDVLLSGSPRRVAAAVLRRALTVTAPPRPPPDPVERWTGFAPEVRRVGVFNSEPMLAALREARPDYVVLAGTDVMKAPSLEIPARGTLNAHPGIVPFARGLGVVQRSLERHVPVGLTVHFVNPGIDTGPIVRRELLPVTETDTVRSLMRKDDERCARALAEVVAGIARGAHPVPVPQRVRYPYCKWMTPDELARLEAEVRGGLALRLYREWRAFFGGDALPPDPAAYPPIAVAPVPPKTAAPV